MKRKNPNNYIKNYIGLTYNTNKYGKLKIIREAIGIGYSERLFEVEFENTGFRTIATLTCITHGIVRDRSVPELIGIGYLGRNNHPQSIMNLLHATWSNMINRCYNENERTYNAYGGSGVRVSERWKCFAYFCDDVTQMYGFEMKLKYPKKYTLDKDYLQSNIPKNQRIYSKETCIWVSIYENILIEGKEKGSTGYYGVITNSSTIGYYIIIYDEIYGLYTDIELAASLFNYIYPLLSNEFNLLNLRNNVPDYPLQLLISENRYYNKNKLIQLLDSNNIIY